MRFESTVVYIPCAINTEFDGRVKHQVNSEFMHNASRLNRLVDDAVINKRLNIANAIKAVIFNDPATIVFWRDGTKTIVKADGEGFDKEKGLAMAISKKCLGNNGSYYEVFRKWIG